MVVVRSREIDGAVEALELIERNNERVGVADGRQVEVTPVGVTNDALLAERHDRVDHRHVDELPLAWHGCSMKRGEHGGGEHRARVNVTDEWPGTNPLIRTEAGHSDEPTVGLRDRVVARPVCVRTLAGARVAVAADRAVDEFGVTGVQRFETEAESVEDPGAHVLDEDIGVVDQTKERRTVIVVFEVEHDAAFVAVVRAEGATV